MKRPKHINQVLSDELKANLPFNVKVSKGPTKYIIDNGFINISIRFLDDLKCHIYVSFNGSNKAYVKDIEYMNPSFDMDQICQTLKYMYYNIVSHEYFLRHKFRLLIKCNQER